MDCNLQHKIKMDSLFKNRTLFIATKHKKERVLAPLFANKLGVSITVPSIDTDMFGTFSGEISRKKTAIETLKEKCLSVINAFEADLVLASEGSFGPHPTIGFVPCNEEYLMLIDTKNNFEIVAKEFSVETNFATTLVTTQDELLAFANKVDFPSHRLILKTAITEHQHTIKGIGAYADLLNYFEAIKATKPNVLVETDMRAMYNPTRMKVIEKAGLKLLDKLFKSCPSCKAPGFDITDFEEGLPCSWCGLPTQSVLYSITTCLKCKHREKQKFPNGKKVEDPQFCSFCNP